MSKGSERAPLPYMPFYGFDFYNSPSVKRMDARDRALYLELLWQQWCDGSIPADEEELWAEPGQSPGNARALLRCFPVVRLDDGSEVRRNPKLERIREKHLLISRARSAAGALGRQLQLGAQPKQRSHRRAKPGQPRAAAEQSPGKRQAKPGRGPGVAGHTDTDVNNPLTPLKRAALAPDGAGRAALDPHEEPPASPEAIAAAMAQLREQLKIREADPTPPEEIERKRIGYHAAAKGAPDGTVDA